MNRRKRPRRPRDRLAAVVESPMFLMASVVIALAALVAALVGPVPELVKDHTETSSLAAEPINKDVVTAFALPLDVRLEDMPAGRGGPCTAPMVEWLRKVGKEIPPYQRISLRNVAQDGAMLSISNVRAVDLKKYDPQPVMHFRCPDAGSAEIAILHLRLDRDPQAQLFDIESGTIKPFAFNLQPGERGIIELHLLGDLNLSYSGRIVADVATGDKMETVALPLNGKSDGFDRISPGKFGRLVISPGTKPGTLSCELYPVGTMAFFGYGSPYVESLEYIDNCSPDKVRSLIAEIHSTS